MEIRSIISIVKKINKKRASPTPAKKNILHKLYQQVKQKKSSLAERFCTKKFEKKTLFCFNVQFFFSFRLVLCVKLPKQQKEMELNLSIQATLIRGRLKSLLVRTTSQSIVRAHRL
jgi:hypothetical protein